MIHIAKSTRLDSAEVIEKAATYFGKQGEGLEEKEFRKCAFCHASSNEPDFPARIGLRGAYHRQCIGCHQEQGDDGFFLVERQDVPTPTSS